MVIPDIDEKKAIMPTDFKKKADLIIAQLNDSVFNLADSDIYKDIDKKEKRAVKKNEIMPTITPTLINCKLNQIFFSFAPIEYPEDIEPQLYLVAYSEFSRVMEEINRYVVMSANKQLYCLFAGLTTVEFNNLCIVPRYSSAFERIITALSGQDFVGAESGLLESKAVITKMQARDIGLNMRQTDEPIIQIQQNKVDKVQVLADLAHFRKVIDQQKR